MKICRQQHFDIGSPETICKNCAFPQNFPTRKLGEITVFTQCKPLNNFSASSYKQYFSTRLVQSVLNFLHMTSNKFQ